jgi:hypothetical protein
LSSFISLILQLWKWNMHLHFDGCLTAKGMIYWYATGWNCKMFSNNCYTTVQKVRCYRKSVCCQIIVNWRLSLRSCAPLVEEVCPKLPHCCSESEMLQEICALPDITVNWRLSPRSCALLVEVVRPKLPHCCLVREMLQQICMLPDDSKLKTISFGIGLVNKIKGIVGSAMKQLTISAHC